MYIYISYNNMYSEKLNYKIIDNLPQKKMDILDVQMINQMIEGYDTVQNTLDINSTNKYDLDFYKKNYIALTDIDRYDSDNDMDYDDNKKKKFIKSTIPNNKNNLNPINTFYIGSMTIIGLFIFYRIIQKTK
jgi:hypothetical protein